MYKRNYKVGLWGPLNEPTPAIPIISQMTLRFQDIFEVEIGNVLVDSGSPYSFIPERDLKPVLEHAPFQTIRISGILKGVPSVSVPVCRLKFKIPDVEVTLDTAFFIGYGDIPIIGREILNGLQVALDGVQDQSNALPTLRIVRI